MAGALKRAGFRQALNAQSSTKRETIGTIRFDHLGNAYRYALAGGALVQGKMTRSADIAAGVMNEACANSHAIGDTVISETITAGVAYAENYFEGGTFQVNDATGEGQSYTIVASTAVTAAGTAITLTLDRPLTVALVATTSEFTIARNPWNGVTHVAGGKGTPTGIPLISVTSAYYCWLQTKGQSCCLMNGTPAVGASLTVSTATAGALDVFDASYYSIVGCVDGTVAVSTEYKPVFLSID